MLLKDSHQASPKASKQEASGTARATSETTSESIVAKKFYSSTQQTSQSQQQHHHQRFDSDSSRSQQQKREQSAHHQNAQQQQKQGSNKAASSSLSTWQADLTSQLALPDDFTPELISQLAAEGYDVVSATGRKPRSRAIQHQVRLIRI